MNDVFVAIDFETADRYRDSACALAMVRVESGKIVHTEYRLIKPPRKYFEFTYMAMRFTEVKLSQSFNNWKLG